MQTKVYKSLDRPSVIFGIRGAYIYVVLIAIGLSIVLGIVVAAVLPRFWFLVVVVIGAAFGIAAALLLQSRMTERQLRRSLAMRDLKKYWVSSPSRLGFYDADKILRKAD